MNQQLSDGSLAPYAAIDAEQSRPRYAEVGAEYRGEFQRDRDRIIHSSALPAPGLQNPGIRQS